MNDTNTINFTTLFSEEDILVTDRCADRNQLFSDLLTLLSKNHNIGNFDIALSSVIKRSAECSTAVAQGILIPHARLENIDTLTIGIAVIKNGMFVKQECDGLVFLIILILSPINKPSQYLQVLSLLSVILAVPHFIETLKKLSTPNEVFAGFKHHELRLPDFVCAGDIMEPCATVLQETNCLKDAVDLFILKGIDEIPVVDKENELIGVVSSRELLRVCLPDYILWMDDLTPIINFEPFIHILQNETHTWLTEILSLEYASSAIDAPAIHTAEEIAKHQGTYCYILDGKKLVGVVSLRRFLSKVFRE